MKRWLAIFAVTSLGCGGGNVAVELERDEPRAAQVDSLSSLAAVRAVRLPIVEVSVHVAGKGAEAVSGDWHTLALEAKEVDLLSVPIDGSTLLGDLSLPAGKITQVRLGLAATEGHGDERIIADAVTEPDGTLCDLILPASAWEPGLKISGLFKQVDVDPAKRTSLVLAFDLKEATRSTEGVDCAWRLNPVLKIKRIRVE